MRKIFNFLLTLSILLIAVNGKAQNGKCGTDERMAELLKANPELLKSLTMSLDEISKLNSNDQKLNKKGTTRYIPVVFHIIHTYGDENISKAQIDDQIRILNEDYQRMNSDTSKTRSIFKGVAADMDIEFKLARIDPSGNCTEGVTRTFSNLTDGGNDAVKSLVRWDYRKYLNIWVVKNIQEINAEPGQTTLGYAYLPYSTRADIDGIVIMSSYVGSIGSAAGNGNKGRTLVHEAGHWLGLIHPFDNECGGNCSNSGDYVCDTPPVLKASFGCPTTNNSCDNDSPDQLDMVENYMDYANGTCQNMFTKGQKVIIDNVLSKASYRANNITTQNHTATGILTNPSCSAIADFSTLNNIVTVCQGGKVVFNDYSYNGTVSNYEWTFNGGTPATSTLAKPDPISYNTPGLYSVTLKVTNATGTNTKTVDKMIEVIPTISSNKTPVSEGFENASVLSNSWRVIENSDYGWKRNTNTKFSGVAGAYAYIDNNTPFNTLYNLISAPYDLSVIKGRQPKLKFMVAYRPAASNNSELLFVYASKDCGQSWSALKAYSNSSGLGVDKVVEVGWVPSSQADWKELVIDLGSYENTKNLMIKFEARSRSGNSIFLDNVNIQAELPASLKPLDPSSVNISIHPNPTKGLVFVEIDTDGKSFDGISLFNATGQEIDNHLELVENKNSNHNYIVQQLPAGVYFLLLKIEGQSIVKKIIVTP